MLCNYNDICSERRENKQCGKCMTGIMVLVGIIAGIVFAAVTVLLFNFGLLTSVYFGALAALIISVIILTVVLVSALFSENKPKLSSCLKCNLGGLFFGLLGTIFSGILAVAANPLTVSVFSLIIVGLVSFFFAFLLVSVLFLVMCLVD